EFRRVLFRSDRRGLRVLIWRAALQPRELDAGLTDIPQAGPWVAIKATLEEPAQPPWRVGWQHPPVDVLAQHRGEHVGRHLAIERAASREHLEHDHAKGPDVGTLVHRL